MAETIKKHLLISFLLFCSSLMHAQGIKIDSLSQILENVTTDTAEVDVLNELAFAYLHVDPIASRDDVDIAYESAQRLDYEEGKAKSLNVYGGLEWALGNYNKSLEYYLQALQIYQALNEELLAAQVTNNIGEIYKKLGEVDKSLSYLLQAIKVLEKHGYPTLGYVNIGEAYLMLSNSDSALYYFQKALVSNENERNVQYEAYAYHGIAEAELELKRYEASMINANKALQLRVNNRDHRGASYTYLLLGKVYDGLEQYDSSLYFHNMALAEAKAIGARDIEMNVLQSKATVFADNNMFDSAYRSHIKHTLIKDELFTEEKSNQIAKLQTTFETELLKKEKQAAEIMLKQQNTVIIAIVMLFILAIAVASAFYKQRKIQQNVNRLLESKNEQIQAQSEEILTQSEEVRKLNQNLERLNQGLENKIRARTQALKDQNKLLAAYAHSNAHELRAPVASVMGLVNLLEKSNLKDNEREIVDHLMKSTEELDAVIREIRARLESNNDIQLDD
ncbi:tetratricopeptide repeat-containing sensor histidine kinase [Fulvivirga sp. 29W222]|uniref:histidine kinase n=1 Tax=Fulvivirga marina TaxID=2494733 RepID=A0A937G141_9BACT|nr:tetratricopeptide repeat protein [Fulvivirga marina]MBL6448717.1 tetratricopeptide repeat-containing sensor histidine kinase [Fulvivirga marina]